MDPDWWHRRVAWLPQRPWLAAGTVRDNLLLGAPDATDAALWQALAEVGMAEVVAAHPGGLDRVLGEDGAGLSAGQRARLALARVLVAERPVVLLDEPSAHLDEATEQAVLARCAGWPPARWWSSSPTARRCSRPPTWWSTWPRAATPARTGPAPVAVVASPAPTRRRPNRTTSHPPRRGPAAGHRARACCPPPPGWRSPRPRRG